MGEQDKYSAIFAGCKWTNEKVDIGILEALVYRSQLFHYKNVYFFLFSNPVLRKDAWKRLWSLEMCAL